MTLSDWLGYFDFGYDWTDEPNEDGEVGYEFIDYQGAYLGDISEERYYDPLDMVSRIADGSSYWIDYIEQDLQDEYEYEGDESLEDEYQFALEVLGEDDLETQIIYYALHPEELIVE